jgi:acyl carrier protein
MTQQDFISGLQEELELDETLTADTDLKQLESWDSMAAMIVIGYVAENFDITLTADDIKGITTVSSLIERIGASKFE